MNKPIVWLFLSESARSDVPLAIPTIAWMARESGAQLESYLEAERDGSLFALTGSTIVGGNHFGAFNFLCAACDVRAIVLGEIELFASSLRAFQIPILAHADSVAELYAQVLENIEIEAPRAALFAPLTPPENECGRFDIAPFLFPEILHRRALAFGASDEHAPTLLEKWKITAPDYLFLRDDESRKLRETWPAAREIDRVAPDDTFGSLTLRVARRWKDKAKGVAFGDPEAIRPLVASLCREARVALFAPKTSLPVEQIRVAPYVGQTSAIGEETALLASEIGNSVLVGRQTGDGDCRPRFGIYRVVGPA